MKTPLFCLISFIFLKEEISDDHSAWWVLGGAAIGIVLSIAVFYASVEVVKQ